MDNAFAAMIDNTNETVTESFQQRPEMHNMESPKPECYI